MRISNDRKIRQNYHFDSQAAPVDSYLPFLEEITDEVADDDVNQSAAATMKDENAPLPSYLSISDTAASDKNDEYPNTINSNPTQSSLSYLVPPATLYSLTSFYLQNDVGEKLCH